MNAELKPEYNGDELNQVKIILTGNDTSSYFHFNLPNYFFSQTSRLIDCMKSKKVFSWTLEDWNGKINISTDGLETHFRLVRQGVKVDAENSISVANDTILPLFEELWQVVHKEFPLGYHNHINS